MFSCKPWVFIPVLGVLLTQTISADPLYGTEKAEKLLDRLVTGQERELVTQPIVTSFLRDSKVSRAFDVLAYYRNQKQSALTIKLMLQSMTILVDEKQVTQAITFIQETSNPTEKYILAQQAMFGLLVPETLPQALKIPEIVTSPLSQSRLIGMIVNYYSSQKDYKNAYDLLETMTDKNEKEVKLVELATETAKAGLSQETWRLIREIQNPTDQLEILESLASYHITQGQADEAILCSSFTKLPQARFLVSQKEAIKLAINNQWPEAIAMARDIPSTEIQSDTLYYLAAKQLQRNSNEKWASEIAGYATKTSYFRGCLSYCKALAEEGRVGQCMVLIKKLNGADIQRRAYLDLAEYMGKNLDYHDSLLYIRQWPDEIKDEAFETFTIAWAKGHYSKDKVTLFLEQITALPIRLRTALTILDQLSTQKPDQSVIFAETMLPGITRVTALLKLARQFEKSNPELSNAALTKAQAIAAKMEAPYRVQATLLVADLSAKKQGLKRNSPLIESLYRDIDQTQNESQKQFLKLKLAKLLLKISERDASLDLYNQLPTALRISYMAELPDEWQKNSGFVAQLNL